MTIKITDTEIQGASASFPTFRNLLLNGNFSINQLRVSGTVNLAAGAYGHDGWKAGAAGCQYTFTAIGNDVAINIVSGTLVQVVGSDYIDGGSHCLSWAGTAQGRLVSGATLSGPLTASPFVISNLTAATIATVEFGPGTLSFVQLETGLFARVFERKEPRTELRRARRYFRTTYPDGSALGATGLYGQAARAIGIDINNAIALQVFEEPMIFAPVWTIYNPNTGATGSIRATQSGATAVITPGSLLAGAYGIYSLVASGTITAGAIYDFHYTAAARL